MDIEIPIVSNQLDQDQEFILLNQGEKKLKIKLHDYRIIFSVPRLYEKIVYEILECASPKVVTRLLKEEVSKALIGYKNGTYGSSMKKMMYNHVKMYTNKGVSIISGRNNSGSI